jgi:thiol:disulfide interchange protein DsbC
MKSLLALVFSLSTIFGAQADEATIRKSVEALTGAKVTGIVKTPYSGLYEVRIGNEVFYADEQGRYIFSGEILDVATQKNLTRERINELSRIKFSDLPLADAVKMVRGNGRRVVATFEDPNCTYCKKLAKELQGMDNITVYTFLYPMFGADSEAKSNAVWCAPDRAKAWTDLMTRESNPKGGKNCATPIARNQALGQKLGIRGTPTLYLADGRRIPGYVSAAELEKALAEIK